MQWTAGTELGKHFQTTWANKPFNNAFSRSLKKFCHPPYLTAKMARNIKRFVDSTSRTLPIIYLRTFCTFELQFSEIIQLYHGSLARTVASSQKRSCHTRLGWELLSLPLLLQLEPLSCMWGIPLFV